jgi:hypothetical protein
MERSVLGNERPFFIIGGERSASHRETCAAPRSGSLKAKRELDDGGLRLFRNTILDRRLPRRGSPWTNHGMDHWNIPMRGES